MPDLALIADLLPPSVASVDARGDARRATLWPGEQAAVARACERRRLEFTTVRTCARAALARLDIQPAAILADRHGAPVWPAGVVGSLTHCEGYRAAAVGRVPHVKTIGIDAEPDQPLPEGVLRLVSLPEERAQLGRLAGEWPGVSWDRLLFSAKEALYKAWFPLTHRWLGFEQALITFDAAGRFTAAVREVRPAGDLTGFSGRWCARDGLLLTAVVC
jgi:4'-phosphopantetheinyl transferase EntD